MAKQKFPSDKELEKMRTLLSQGIASKPLAKDASNVDKMKFTLCERFVIYKLQNKITQKDLAQKIAIDEALMSKILHYHFDEFTVDRLVRYLEALHQHVEIKIQVA